MAFTEAVRVLMVEIFRKFKTGKILYLAKGLFSVCTNFCSPIDDRGRLLIPSVNTVML